ncbi:MAG: hypothetical protein HQL20_10110 [Candidatus Omnitrophica bacterium]|nr:hypothetical protein [Candidatus Omnitrophota bacterium]
MTHNVSSDAYEQGTVLVISKIRAGVAAQVARQFPDLPPEKKELLIKEQFNKVISEHKAELRQAFDTAGQTLLNSSGEQKHYLLASDSYYFLSLTQELLTKGSFGTKTEGSKFFNPLMLAPIGYWQPQTWHPYMGAIAYKIVHFFAPKEDLMFGVAFTSVLLFPFVLAAFFFACRALGCGAFSSFIAATFFVLAPIYLKRSTFAWFDDDAYNVFFPLVVSGLLFLAIDQFQKLKRSLLIMLLIGISLALYARFWVGWGFLWGLSAAGIAAVTALTFFKDRASFKPSLFLVGGLVLAPFIAVGIIFGFAEVWQILLFATNELKKFIAPSFKGWPDLFIVVGELKKGSLSDVIELTGGPVMFLGGACALIWASVRALRKYDTQAAKTTVLGIFFAATFFLSLSAQRFTILCLTPLALLFAFGLEELWCQRANISERLRMPNLQQKKISSGTIAVILALSLIVPFITAQKGIRSLLSPIFNSAWERALIKLRDNTPKNSVVNTWWSPGHFVKAIAQRSVTFDGASINGEQAYWLTRVYLSQTEDEALGILRMLNVSSNNACDYLQKLGLPLSRAVPLIYQATTLNRTEALNLYRSTLSERDASSLIKMTHGIPPPSYVLIYNEIVEGNVMLGYLGKWDFKKIEALNSSPAQRQTIPSRSSKDYVSFIWNLVGGPYRQSPTLNLKERTPQGLLFDQGVLLNPVDMSVKVRSPQYGTGIPASIFYAENGTVIEKKLAGADLSYSAIFFKDDSGTPRCVLLDRQLANSLIVRMYYFSGLGLKHFKPFARESDLTGRTRIYIYEVNWDK